MKVGDLVEYIEPGIEISMGRGIIIDMATTQVLMLWDEGHLTRMDNVHLNHLEVISEGR